METCKDCCGKGTIQLFTTAKPCKACAGTGKVGGCCAAPDFYTVTFSGVGGPGCGINGTYVLRPGQDLETFVHSVLAFD
jgi:hypothetical protein